MHMFAIYQCGRLPIQMWAFANASVLLPIICLLVNANVGACPCRCGPLPMQMGTSANDHARYLPMQIWAAAHADLACQRKCGFLPTHMFAMPMQM